MNKKANNEQIGKQTMNQQAMRKEAMGVGDEQEVGIKEQGKWKKNNEKSVGKKIDY